MNSSRVLAGDIGGTKTLLALARLEQGRVIVEREQRFETASFPALTPMVQSFLGAECVPAACFGVAAPVSDRRVRLTNLDFMIDADELAASCGIEHVSLLNDFAVIGYGLDALSADELTVLQAGDPVPGSPRVLLGAGTGLGQAILAWQGDHYAVLSTEGGHADFAPQGEEQFALWRMLAREYGHVSYERVLSGPGLVDLFRFVTGTAGSESAAAISASALDGSDEAARAALRLFVRIYGQQAGNLALTALARGGVYVAGGIAPQIIEFMRQGEFITAFRAKGRYEALLASIPVSVVMNPKVGLLGAVLFASRRLPT